MRLENRDEKLFRNLLSQNVPIPSLCLGDDQDHKGNYGNKGLPYVHFLERLWGMLKLEKNNAILVLALPLSVTDSLSTAHPTNLDVDLDDDYRPTLYLQKNDEFMIDADEEYRKMIETGSELRAVFRSWRDAESSKLNWEYSNYIFVWTPYPYLRR